MLWFQHFFFSLSLKGACKISQQKHVRLFLHTFTHRKEAAKKSKQNISLPEVKKNTKIRKVNSRTVMDFDHIRYYTAP